MENLKELFKLLGIGDLEMPLKIDEEKQLIADTLGLLVEDITHDHISDWRKVHAEGG